ncbi:hypothetical protein Tco_1461219 [Tanacetum coccineum]
MVKLQAYEDLTGEGRLLDESGDWHRYRLRMADVVVLVAGVMVLVAGVVFVGGSFGGGCSGVGDFSSSSFMIPIVV